MVSITQSSMSFTKAFIIAIVSTGIFGLISTAISRCYITYSIIKDYDLFYWTLSSIYQGLFAIMALSGVFIVFGLNKVAERSDWAGIRDMLNYFKLPLIHGCFIVATSIFVMPIIRQIELNSAFVIVFSLVLGNIMVIIEIIDSLKNTVFQDMS